LAVGRTVVASVDTAGRPTPALGERAPSLDRAGRLVAFEAGSNGAGSNVLVRDLWSATTIVASLTPTGKVQDYTAWRPSLSADGRLVAFDGWSAGLVLGDTNEAQDVFVRDLVVGTTDRVGVATDGTQANQGGWLATLSADGSTVLFVSASTNLVPDDTNRRSDIFARDLRTGVTSRVSVASDGAQANGESTRPAVSADGLIVAFYSDATNLVAGDTNGFFDLFVHDRSTGRTTLVSVAFDGSRANGNSGPPTSCAAGDANASRCSPGSPPAVRADGRLVIFESDAGNLVRDDTNRVGDIFVHDRDTGQTLCLSRRADGVEADADSSEPAVSADGRIVAFTSRATNLAADDTNREVDVFVVDLTTGRVLRASSDPAGRAASGSLPGLSGDGRVVAFVTSAPDLLPGAGGISGIVALGLPAPGAFPDLLP
jgi:Tol biopolymer transport system component